MLTKTRTNTPSVQPQLFPSEQLVSIQNGKAMTSSLQVANYFGKDHFNVLRDIRKLECSKEFQAFNFEFSFYIRDLQTGGQKKEPLYYMTKDGFSFLVMGFTGKIAAKFKEDYINAFNKMEGYIRGNNIDNKLLYEFIEHKLSNISKSYLSYSESLQKRYNLKFRLCTPEVIIPKKMSANTTIERNLDNMFAIYQNNLLAGLFQTYQAFKYEKENQVIRRYLQDISDKLYKDFDIYPS